MERLTRRDAGILAALGLSGLLAKAGSAAASVPAGTRPRLDHIIWAVPVLEDGRRQFEQMTGVLPASGGQGRDGAPAQNALVSLGDGAYLEVFGLNLSKSTRWAPLVADGKPHLASFVMRVGDRFARLLTKLPDAGLKPQGPRDMGRVRPDGGALAWTLLDVTGSTVDGSMPFFIDWLASTPHPSEDSPGGVRLKQLEVGHPEPEVVERIFRALEINLPVYRAAAPSMRLTLDTPKGVVTLT